MSTIYICIYCVRNKILYIWRLEKKRETEETRKRVERDTWKQSTRVSNINKLPRNSSSNLSYLCQSNYSRRIRGTVFFFRSFVVRLAGLILEEKEENCKISAKDLATGTRNKMEKRDFAREDTRGGHVAPSILSLCPPSINFVATSFPRGKPAHAFYSPFNWTLWYYW